MIDPLRNSRAAIISRRGPAIHARTSVFGVITLILALAGCGTIGNDDGNGEFWSPFSSQSAWDVGDGRIRVEMSGYERGHDPGGSAEFTVKIENRRDQPAELDICAKLIDETEILQSFEQFHVSIPPDGSDTTTFNVTFDEETEPRAYGFAVVIGEIGALVHTVRVGIPDDEAGPWLDADELVCD